MKRERIPDARATASTPWADVSNCGASGLLTLGFRLGVPRYVVPGPCPLLWDASNYQPTAPRRAAPASRRSLRSLCASSSSLRDDSDALLDAWGGPRASAADSAATRHEPASDNASLRCPRLRRGRVEYDAQRKRVIERRGPRPHRPRSSRRLQAPPSADARGPRARFARPGPPRGLPYPPFSFDVAFGRSGGRSLAIARLARGPRRDRTAARHPASRRTRRSPSLARGLSRKRP